MAFGEFHHIVETGASLLQDLFDVVEYLARLGKGIPRSYQLARCVQRYLSRDED